MDVFVAVLVADDVALEVVALEVVSLGDVVGDVPGGALVEPPEVLGWSVEGEDSGASLVNV